MRPKMIYNWRSIIIQYLKIFEIVQFSMFLLEVLKKYLLKYLGIQLQIILLIYSLPIPVTVYLSL